MTAVRENDIELRPFHVIVSSTSLPCLSPTHIHMDTQDCYPTLREHKPGGRTEAFQRLEKALRVLLDPESRIEYNYELPHFGIDA